MKGGGEGLYCNGIDLNTDSSAKMVMKKAIPLQFRIAEETENVKTLEGLIEAPPGSYIMTGTKGENWPIPPDKFNKTYDIKTGLGTASGTASKKAIPVPAKQMKEDFFVSVSWSKGDLQGHKGDWLVQYGLGDHGVVGEDIFVETYDLV